MVTAEPRVLTPEQVAARQRQALRKAVEQRAWERVESFTFTEYGVTSSDGKTPYWVCLADAERDGRPSCSCAAGHHDIPCYHVAAVVLTAVPPSWRDALLGLGK